MADVAPVAPAAANAPQPGGRPAQGGWGNMYGTVARMALMWFVMSYFKGQKAPAPSGTPAAIANNVAPRFGKGDLFDVHVFVSEQQHVWPYDLADLVWSEIAVPLAGDEIRRQSIPFFPSEAVQLHNASVYLHVAFMRTGSPIDPSDPDFIEENVYRTVHSLVRYMPRPKKVVGKNLLSGMNDTSGAQARSLLPAWLQAVVNKNATDDEAATEAASPVLTQEEEEAGAKELVSWFKPNITIAMVDIFNTYPATAIPAPVAPFLHIRARPLDGARQYDPVIHFDEFWLLRDKHVMLNETVSNVTLHLTLSRMSAAWFQVLEQMDKSFAMQVDMGMSKEGESEELKRVLLEGNPILLVVTFAVSLLHTVFDMLAFKNDIGFWKNNKSMEGLSARSVIINAVCQLVIFLYLLDNETSYVVLFSSFLGMGIEFWKVTKAMKVEFLPVYPYVKVADRATYEDSPTKQYDKEAMTYLGWVMYPLLAGYCVYTLLYQSHKSWYSWIISSGVGAVYMFGFILMCPQLYLNYKLKSVAHLPWRQMTYKFLNTIIDDLFAFVIKMPTLHRLSVFRDDLVFLVYIYQRWVYRVDKTRVNEFGFSADNGAAAAAEGTAPPAVTDDSTGGTDTGGSHGDQTLVDGAADRQGEADVAASDGRDGKKDN